MSRMYTQEVDAVLIKVGEQVDVVLDDHVFTEDEDPTDRDDKFTVTVILTLRSQGAVDYLRAMAQDKVSVIITSYD